MSVRWVPSSPPNPYGSPIMNHSSRILAAVSTVTFASCASAQVHVTEAMSSSGTGGTDDWIEITNFGSSAISISGWRFDDSSFNFGASQALNGVTTISAGESVIFIESAGGANIASFRSFWGGLAGVQVGFYSGSGLGLSSGGDGAIIFTGAGAEISRVSFGAATTGNSFFYGWTVGGTVDPSFNGIVSSLGSIGTQVSLTSANALGNVASPGTAMALIPAPGALALLAVAGRGRRRPR
ncbi:MAG: lamin tail domain-containing protein [Phycisphaerales bacterium]|nr:lamin tail domain-containing protein [Phycisphaerales bacterium]